MDTGTTIVTAIIIAICLLPFIWLVRIRKKRERQLLSYISNIVQQHQSKLTKFEFCSDFIIGLDERTSLVFFLKKCSDEVTSKQVDLKGIQDCRVIRTSKANKVRNPGYQEIDKLELCFTPIPENKPDIYLEMYNSDKSAQLGMELPLIEKWSKIINNIIVELKATGYTDSKEYRKSIIGNKVSKM